MGKALYRAYRSTSFDEVLGQEHITTALKNALKAEQISHAYLLTGPRGVGKTSVARILAHEVNNLEYSRDKQHIDIIEIDAASNRRIDEIRELRERVMVAPALAKFKVYIIDEVHMLTREAFNALLKTLEEPPAHVIFILATTEFHKLPDTIVSRCLRFNFKPIDTETALSHLRHISKKEGLDMDDDALALIAQHGGGSFRDSISQLDQMRNLGSSVSLADVQRMLGSAPEDKIAELLECVKKGSPKQLFNILSVLIEQGVAPSEIAKQLSAVLRGEFINGESSLGQTAAIKLLNSLLEIPSSPQEQAQLELVLLDTQLEQLSYNKPLHTLDIAAVRLEPEIYLPDVPAHVVPVQNRAEDAPAALDRYPVNQIDQKQPLQSILLALKAKNNTLYSIARMASTEFSGDKLVFTFKFAFHYKQANEPKNKKLISDIVTNKYPNTKFIYMKLASKDSIAPDKKFSRKAADTSVASITNIFGGGEVLES